MPNNPKISVVMSVYDGEKYLREAIDSILNQTFTDFEFIIVNDGSTDSSLEIIQSYHDDRIRAINNKINIGLTKSLNNAIREARGEYIARQDADDISLPNRFEEQIKYLAEHPEVALLGTGIYMIDNGGKILGKRIALANPSKSLLKSNQFNHGSTMFRREVIAELGGYNELFTYGQDYELWLRMATCHEVKNLRQVLYKLRFHDETIRLKHGDGSVLSHLLALRLVQGELDVEVLKTIKDDGIESLYSYLNKNEKACFHKAVAYTQAQNKNIKLAREEYKKVLQLNPLDFKNGINIILSYFGRGVMVKGAKLHETIRNFGVYLENWHSK